MQKKAKERRRQVHPVIFALVTLFATSSWVDYYAMMVELPVLVALLPEGWTLPSYVCVIIMIASAAPIFYVGIGKLFKFKDSKRSEDIAVYVIIGTGVVACFLLIFFWDSTAFIFGQERSVALLMLILFLSVVDATSCVVYFGFMYRFPAAYMPAYITGEEFGGLLTGIIGLGQGASGDPICMNVSKILFNQTTGENQTVFSVDVHYPPPRFSPSLYFLFVMCIMLISMVAFSILRFAPFSKKHMIGERIFEQDECHDELTIYTNNTHPENAVIPLKAEHKPNREPDMTYRNIAMLCLYGWIACVLYGFLPSVGPFAALPFGSLSYMLCVRLATMANPFACLSTMFIHVRSLRSFVLLVLAGTMLIAVATVFASMSPNPPLVNHVMGTPIMVVTFVLLTVILAFTRTSLSAELHIKAGHRGLVWAGAATLIGQAVGTTTAFILINVLKVLVEKEPCVEF